MTPSNLITHSECRLYAISNNASIGPLIAASGNEVFLEKFQRSILIIARALEPSVGQSRRPFAPTRDQLRRRDPASCAINIVE